MPDDYLTTQQTDQNQQIGSLNYPANAADGQSPQTPALQNTLSQSAQASINSNINSIYPNPTGDMDSGLNQNDGNVNDSQPPKKRIFGILIVLIILLLVGGSGYYYFFMFKNNVIRKIDKLCLVTDKTNNMISDKYFLTEHNLTKFSCNYNFSVDKTGESGGVDMVGFNQDYNIKYTTYDSKIKDYKQMNSTQKTSLIKEFNYNGHNGAIYKTQFITNSSPDGLQLFYDQPNGVVNIVTYEKSFSAVKLINLLKTLDFDYGFKAAQSLSSINNSDTTGVITQSDQNAIRPCDARGNWQNITVSYLKTVKISSSFSISVPNDANFSGENLNNLNISCSKNYGSHFTFISLTAKHVKDASGYDFQSQTLKQSKKDAKLVSINLNNSRVSRQYAISPYDNLNKVYQLSVVSELKINGEYYLTTLSTGDIAYKTQDLEVYNRFINSIK